MPRPRPCRHCKMCSTEKPKLWGKHNWQRRADFLCLHRDMRCPEWSRSLDLVPARLAIATGCAASNGGFQLGYHGQAIQRLAKIMRPRWHMPLTAVARAVCTVDRWRCIERLASGFGDGALSALGDRPVRLLIPVHPVAAAQIWPYPCSLVLSSARNVFCTA